MSSFFEELPASLSALMGSLAFYVPADALKSLDPLLFFEKLPVVGLLGCRVVPQFGCRVVAGLRFLFGGHFLNEAA